MWQKITISSCNKTFKQVLSFLSNLTSALFILRIALSSHLPQIRSKFLNQQKQSSGMFCKNGVLRKFAKFIRKHLCQRLFFNKITGTGSDSCFPVNSANFLRAPPVAASELVKKCCFKLFRILQIEHVIYKKTKKLYCKRFEHIPCFFSGNIFDYD